MSWKKKHCILPLTPWFLISHVCKYTFVASNITRFCKIHSISVSGVSSSKHISLHMHRRLGELRCGIEHRRDFIFLRTLSTLWTEQRKNTSLFCVVLFSVCFSSPLQHSRIAIKQIYWWYVWLFQQNREGAVDQHSHLISHHIPPEPMTSPATHSAQG